MARIRICKERECKDAATTAGFCRLHYLKSWQRIRLEKRKRAAKKLNRYIEHILKKHPDRYLEVIKKDLRSPEFEKYVDEQFGIGEEGIDHLFDDSTYEEEIQQLIAKLKIEKDF